MNVFEKIYSLSAIGFAVALVILLFSFPEFRQLETLLRICLVGLIVNTGLVGIVLRDIFIRQFPDKNSRYLWLGLVLFIWPSIIFYLVKYGFWPRS